MKYPFILFLFLICSCSSGPSPDPASSQDSLSHLYPLTRDTHSIFPSRMIISGKVSEYHPGFTCGRTCSSAYLKVDLSKEPPAYPRMFAYIAIPCFTRSEEEMLNKTIALEVHKIAVDDTSCFFMQGSPIKTFGITPWYEPYSIMIIAGDTVKVMPRSK